MTAAPGPVGWVLSVLTPSVHHPFRAPRFATLRGPFGIPHEVRNEPVNGVNEGKGAVKRSDKGPVQ